MDIKMAEPGAEAPSTFDLPESSKQERAAQEAKLAEMETKRKIRSIVVPTVDSKVRNILRQLGEPITLFGEKEMERRERLQRIVATREGDIDIDMSAGVDGLLVVEEAAKQTELFYTEGPVELQQARITIARNSLRAAAARIHAAKALRANADDVQAFLHRQQYACSAAKALSQQSSELGSERPISCCQFSPDGTQLATCDWGGVLSLWSSPACTKQWTVRAHEERCTGLAWHPTAVSAPNISKGSSKAAGGHSAAVDIGSAAGDLASDQQMAEASGDARGSTTDAGAAPEASAGSSPGVLALATGSADCSARLFDNSGKLLRKLEGHTDRLGRLAFHPEGRHLGTASYDLTWRLWDVETGACLLEQEGHSRPVYTVAFHPDGSLAASAGLDAYGRVWDLRTGRSVYTLQGHVKQVLALDFAPNGQHLVSGGGDNTCKVWDLRTRKCLYTMPGHRSLVSSVKYECNHGGAYILTSGYDAVAKVWSARDFKLLLTLAGHEGKIMYADIAKDDVGTVATVSYDRTVKIWAPEDIPGAGNMEL